MKVDFVGFEYPIYLNNSNSKRLSTNKSFHNNSSLKFSWFVDRKKQFGLGATIGGYTHDFDLNIIKEEINAKGIQVYGDMWLHDWTEWRIGPDFSFTKRIFDKHLFNTHISSGLMLSSRGVPVIIYEDPDKFIYPAWKLGYGGYVDLDINYFYIVSESFHNLGVGVGFEMGFGNVKTEYEVRYGQGTDLNVYDFYDYKHNFIVWRYGFSFKARADLSIFKKQE